MKAVAADRGRALRGRAAALRGPLLVVAVSTLGSCAPDAVRNNAATGFNGYLDSLKTACPNLQIGASDIGLWLQYSGTGDNYNYWLDMTSRLYYNRVSSAEYRSAVAAQLGDGPRNGASFDCIVGNLPPRRPDAPTPAGVIKY